MPSEAEPPHSPTWNSVEIEVQPVNAKRDIKGDVKYPRGFFALTRETPKLLRGQDTILTSFSASPQEDITTEPESHSPYLKIPTSLFVPKPYRPRATMPYANAKIPAHSHAS